MSATVARKEFAAILRPLLPDTWQLVDGSRSVDLTNKTVVRIRQTTIRPFDAAPIGYHGVTLTVNIRVPEQSTQAAEDRLDSEVDDLIHALDGMNVLWESAEKVLMDATTKTLGYDITVTIASQKE